MEGQSTLKAWDAINGAEGKCTAVIDGQIEEMLYLKNIKADLKKKKVQVPVMGSTMVKHKTAGSEGTGKATLYYATTIYRRQMEKYAKTGVDTYFDLIIENRDPSSNIGGQRVILHQVNLDGITLAKTDVESTTLDEDIDFTFNGFDYLEDFITPVGEFI